MSTRNDAENKKPHSDLDIEAWDKVASEYSRKIDEGDVLREHLLNERVLFLLGKIGGKRVLDAGCGEGYFSNIMSNAGASVRGFDASPRLIEIAKRKHIEHTALSFVAHDLKNPLSFQASSFDAILANLVLMDFDPLEGAVVEFSRVLKRGGFFVFSILHPFLTAGTLHKSAKEKFLRKLPHYDIAAYKTRRRILWKITGVSVKTAVYHRPLEYYLNLIRENSFTLDTLEEPTLDPLFCRDKNNFLKLCAEVPPFLIVKAIRN